MRALVAGCGFLGKAVTRSLHAADWEVAALVQSDDSAAALAAEPYSVFARDVAAPGELRDLPQPKIIVHCVSSGGGGAEAYRHAYLEGARALRDAFPEARILFAGSTSVYVQTDGGWVDESSPANPDRETGRILLETENLVLAAGGSVARLAGLYGPGRSALLRKFLAGEAVLEEGGGRFINQIHREDAASAVLALIDAAPGLYNVSDDTPLTQRACCEWMAARFNRPLPPEGPIPRDRKRGWTSKRVSNARLRGTGWKCLYPSFMDAVEVGAV